MKKNIFIYFSMYLLIFMVLIPSLQAKDPEITTSVAPQYLFEGSKIMFEVKHTDSKRLRWEFGDGSAAIGGPKHNHIYKSRGMYKVKVYDLESNFQGPIEKRLTILKEGREIILENQVFFPGIPVKIRTRKFITPSLEYDFGDGTIKIGGQSITHAYKTSGTFTIKVTDYAGRGPKKITKPITITPDNRSIVLPNEIIAGEPVDIRMKNAAGGNFTWEFSPGQRASGLFIKQMAFQRPGNVKVTIKDTTGKYPSLTQNFMVKPDNRKLKTSLTFALPEESVRIEALRFRGPIKWDFGDGTVRTTSSKTGTHRYKENGRYTITARDFNGNSPKVFSQTITVNELTPGFQINLLEIAFTDGKYYQVVSRKSPPPLYYVKMKALGRGILKGKWIVDEQVIGLFEVLLHQNKIVDLRGNRVISLPLIDTGIHHFTIEFTNYTFPQTSRIPILRYFVTETGAIEILSPGPGAKVTETKSLQLQWKWASKFKKKGYGYQLLVSEIPVQFLTEDRIIAAWKAVGSKNQYRLDVSAFKPGKWVYWQVRAVGPDGEEVLTTSDISSFKLAK
jgi:PKD repeat protein